MRKKMSTLNRTVFVTMFSILAVFCIIIVLAINILLSHSKTIAREHNKEQADYITNLVTNSLYFMTSLLNFTQQSLSELDRNSASSGTSAENILITMLDLTPNVYCAWFIFEKGRFYEDEFFIREFIKRDGIIIENHTLNSSEELDDPEMGTIDNSQTLQPAVYMLNRYAF